MISYYRKYDLLTSIKPAKLVADVVPSFSAAELQRIKFVRERQAHADCAPSSSSCWKGDKRVELGLTKYHYN